MGPGPAAIAGRPRARAADVNRPAQAATSGPRGLRRGGALLVLVGLLVPPLSSRAERVELPPELATMTIEELLRVRVQVGSRGNGRVLALSPVPVDVITAARIEATGLAETSKILQRLVPSFHYPRATVTDGTDHVRPFTLRGLEPDQVLVLVNGKRRHTGALLHLNQSVGRGTTGVDLNAIPAHSIERIEILRDGAAAQYGSDAIAGVINIRLKSHEERIVRTTQGVTGERDGRVQQYVLAAGTRIADGFVHGTVEVRDRGLANRAGLDGRTMYFEGDPRNDDPALNDRRTHERGDPEMLDVLLRVNGAVPVGGAGMELYSFGGLDVRESRSGGFFRRPLDDRNVRGIHPDGFLPRIAPRHLDGDWTLGARGDGEDWTWDLSNTFGGARLDVEVENSVNASLGVESPTSFDDGALQFLQNSTNVDLVRDVDLGLSDEIALGFGGEVRVEYFQIVAGEAASHVHGGVPVLDGPNAGDPALGGSQVFPGFRPEDEIAQERVSVGLYGDVESEVAEGLLVELAGRFESFPDFDPTVDGKVAVAWHPLPEIGLRSSASTGFRAPSLAQSHFAATATNFLGDVPFEVGTFRVDSPLARALGARDLEPERSVHLSGGISLLPVPGLRISGDVFLTDIDDRIVLSETITHDPSIFDAEVVALLDRFGVGGARFFTNAVDTRTYGADVRLEYERDLGPAGRFGLGAQVHHGRTEIRGAVDALPLLTRTGSDAAFSRATRDRLTRSQPGDNVILSLDYRWREARLLLRGQRFGEVLDIRSVEDQQTEIGATWLLDVELAIRPLDWLEIAAGAHNALDETPDFLRDTNDLFGPGKSFQYSQFSPAGFLGAYYYGRLAARF